MRFPSSYRSSVGLHRNCPGAIAKGRERHLGPPCNMHLVMGVPVPFPAKRYPYKVAPDWVKDWLTPYQKTGLDFALNRDGTLRTGLVVQARRSRVCSGLWLVQTYAR